MKFFKKYDQELKNKVNLFIPDPPYNVLQNERDKFTAIDMFQIHVNMQLIF